MKFEDLDEIIKIEIKVFPNPWPRFFFESDLANNSTVKVVAVDSEQVIGYSLGTFTGPEFHITNIAVNPAYHRQKVGYRLLKWLEEKAIKLGCVESFLEVRTSNQTAIDFYEKIGYQISYTRHRYYLDGADAYIMKRKLGQKIE